MMTGPVQLKVYSSYNAFGVLQLTCFFFDPQNCGYCVGISELTIYLKLSAYERFHAEVFILFGILG